MANIEQVIDGAHFKKKPIFSSHVIVNLNWGNVFGEQFDNTYGNWNVLLFPSTKQCGSKLHPTDSFISVHKDIWTRMVITEWRVIANIVNNLGVHQYGIGWINYGISTHGNKVQQSGSVVKNLPTSEEDTGSVSWLGRSPGEGNGNLLQYSCLGNPMDRRAWQVAVYGVAKELDTT